MTNLNIYIIVIFPMIYNLIYDNYCILRHSHFLLDGAAVGWWIPALPVQVYTGSTKIMATKV